MNLFKLVYVAPSSLPPSFDTVVTLSMIIHITMVTVAMIIHNTMVTVTILHTERLACQSPKSRWLWSQFSTMAQLKASCSRRAHGCFIRFFRSNIIQIRQTTPMKNWTQPSCCTYRHYMMIDPSCRLAAEFLMIIGISWDTSLLKLYLFHCLPFRHSCGFWFYV